MGAAAQDILRLYLALLGCTLKQGDEFMPHRNEKTCSKNVIKKIAKYGKITQKKQK